MITYSNIEEQDLDQVIALYETYLNSGDYIRNAMRTEFHTEDYLGMKACDGDKLVGFFSGQGGIGFTYPHPELEREIQKEAAGRKLYTPDGILVLEDYRKHGVAGELVRRMKEALLCKKVELALVELWIYPDGSVPAQNPLKGIGKAVYQKTVPLFYKDLKKYHIKCPLCGDDCSCGALIELLEVKE